MINLTRIDQYENHIIPDEDVELALKVIRTMRDVCLMPNVFDADGALVLSHAHAKIHDLVQRAIAGEEEEKSANGKSTDAPTENDPTEDHVIHDPDFAV